MPTRGPFIFASTVRNYIEGSGGLERQLEKFADRPAIKGLDGLHREILKNALDKFPEQEDVTEWLRILGTIILLRNQLSVNDLGPLLKLSPSHVRGCLRDVQPVLMVSENPGEVVRTLHASFHNFLIDRERAGVKTDSNLSGNFLQHTMSISPLIA